MKIITNNHARDPLYWHELTDKERAKFDYYTEERLSQEDPEFVRYKGEIYDLNDVEMIRGYQPEEFRDWDGIVTETFFSGILFKFIQYGSEEERAVVCGRYYT